MKDAFVEFFKSEDFGLSLRLTKPGLSLAQPNQRTQILIFLQNQKTPKLQIIHHFIEKMKKGIDTGPNRHSSTKCVR